MNPHIKWDQKRRSFLFTSMDLFCKSSNRFYADENLIILRWLQIKISFINPLKIYVIGLKAVSCVKFRESSNDVIDNCYFHIKTFIFAQSFAMKPNLRSRRNSSSQHGVTFRSLQRFHLLLLITQRVSYQEVFLGLCLKISYSSLATVKSAKRTL